MGACTVDDFCDFVILGKGLTLGNEVRLEKVTGIEEKVYKETGVWNIDRFKGEYEFEWIAKYHKINDVEKHFLLRKQDFHTLKPQNYCARLQWTFGLEKDMKSERSP
eukprot:UN03290